MFQAAADGEIRLTAQRPSITLNGAPLSAVELVIVQEAFANIL
jgi:hypothetical protein